MRYIESCEDKRTDGKKTQNKIFYIDKNMSRFLFFFVFSIINKKKHAFRINAFLFRLKT